MRICGYLVVITGFVLVSVAAKFYWDVHNASFKAQLEMSREQRPVSAERSLRSQDFELQDRVTDKALDYLTYGAGLLILGMGLIACAPPRKNRTKGDS